MDQGDGESRRLWDLSERVLGACIEVHRHLGPGLLESAYEECLCHELSLTGLGFARQRPLPVVYKGVMLDCGYRLDVVVEEKLVLELKAVDHLLPVHEAQVLTYLKLTGLDVGLLVNFNTPALRRGIRRLVRRGADHVHLARFRTTSDQPTDPGRP
jgi:GxxExxY protein